MTRASIHFFSEDIDFPNIHKKEVKDWIIRLIQSKKKEAGKLNFIFVSDDKILEVNKQYLNHDYYTDVITFDYCEGKTISGDIFISLDTVKSNASLYKQDFSKELHRVIIHGVLHLIGYQDKTDAEAKEMRTQENLALELYQEHF